MLAAFGLIPDWQYSADPAVNPFLNPHVTMPDGWTQAYTVQPTGATMSPIAVPIPSPLYGANIGCIPGSMGCGSMPMAGLGYPVLELPPPLSGIGSWAWEHRKGVALGVVGVVGLALLAGLGSILK